MTDDLGHDVDAHNENEQGTTDSEIASTSEIVTGAEGADELVGQADLNIEQPGDGQVVPITSAAGQRYTVVDPEAPTVELDGTSLILVYPNDGRVVFENLGDVVNLPDAPVFVIAGVPIPSATIYNNAVALVGQSLPNVAAPDVPGFDRLPDLVDRLHELVVLRLHLVERVVRRVIFHVVTRVNVPGPGAQLSSFFAVGKLTGLHAGIIDTGQGRRRARGV